MIYDLQNIHPKWVTAKIFILNELVRLIEKAPTVVGAFSLSSSIRTDWRERFGSFFEIEIATSLLGIRGFLAFWGVDKKGRE